MAEKEEKKGLFGKAVDALSSKDKKRRYPNWKRNSLKQRKTQMQQRKRLIPL